MALFDEWDRYGAEELLERQEQQRQRGAPPPSPPSGVVDDPGGVDEPPDDFGTFTPPAYSGPMRPSFGFPNPPRFNPRMFGAPSLDEAKNEPGYQFRLGSGVDAIDRSAAARGVLRSGNTLRDIVEYGQNFGEQAYQNMFDRAVRAYQLYYQGESDKFRPLLMDYQNRFGAEQGAGMAGFDLYGDIYQNEWEAAQRNEDRLLQAWEAAQRNEEILQAWDGA